MTEEKKDPYDIKTRVMKRQEDLMNMTGDLLVPVTQGFPHINLDMSFSYFGNMDLIRVENYSVIIAFTYIHGLKRSSYLAMGQLATLEISRRSRNAKSMDMFTSFSTTQKQTYRDETQEKKGFSWFGFGKKKGEEGG